METIQSESSNIKEFKYEDKTKELTVVFRHGGTYKYKHVERKMFLAMKIAPSHGKFFANHIKDKYITEKQ